MSDTIDTGAIDSLLQTVATFLEDAPGMLDDMEQAANEKDADKLRLVSHSLKTNSAQFGATALFEICRDIEAQAKDGEFADALLAQAQAEFENVQKALENLREV